MPLLSIGTTTREATMPRILSEGTTGDDVRMLQALLNYHRVLAHDLVLNVDGSFGPNTTKRVKSFQTQNLLDADGIVGEGTAAMLMTICQFSAVYTVSHVDHLFNIGAEPGQTTVEREYELSNGLKVTLDPWASPPAKPMYVLEFEASWVIKNPALPVPFTLSLGGEIGRTFTTHSPDAPYIYSGSGTITGKLSKDFTLASLTLDTALQAQFEAEHEVGSSEVQVAAKTSLASGISFAVLRNRFYLFTQGEMGAAVQWADGTVQPSVYWEGSAGFKLSF